MINSITKAWKYLTDNTPEGIAHEELMEARRKLIQHQSSAIYNQKMAEYYGVRIKELEKYPVQTGAK